MIGFLKPVGMSCETRKMARTYHCSLCRTVKETYGLRYSLFAGPDLVFFNVFLDAASAQDPALVRSGCVILPKRLSRMQVRKRTEHARFTAAFGVAMAVAKLKDNYEDEGGLLRWLAWRFFRPGGEKARAHLTEMGFDVAELDDWMKRQAEIEAGGTMPLDEAAVPTARIAQLLFARARLSASETIGGVAHRIGEHVGQFLFYLDNLLDFFDDVRGGQYNALARAFEVEKAPKRLPPAVASAGLAGAAAQVEALEPLIAQLPASPHRDYVERVLTHGFRHRVQRFEKLAVAEGRRPNLRAISMPLRPALHVKMANQAVRSWRNVVPKLQLGLFFVAFLLAPRSAWAARWMASMMVGATGANQTDGGPMGDPVPGDPVPWTPPDTTPPDDESSNLCGSLGEWCWDSCGDDCCSWCWDSVCEPSCQSACDGACDGVCDGACDGACGGGGEAG